MRPNQESDENEELREGRFSNFFKIGYNAFEFVLEFGQFYAGNSCPRLHTRIVTNPIYIKELLALLQESVEEYEKSFSRIDQKSEPGQTPAKESDQEDSRGQVES